MNDKRYITYTIESWMTEEYGLKGNELLLFAIIYNFSKFGGENAWYGSLSMIEKITGMTKRTAINTYKNLEKRGMIKKDEVLINNVKTCRYTAVIDESKNEDIKKSRNDGGNGVVLSANDTYDIPQQETNEQESDANRDEYYNSLADSFSEMNEPIQETLFDEPVKEEPKPKNKKTYEPEIKEVIDFLNSKTGGKNKPTNKHTIKDLTRWFKQGYTVDEIKKMISYKCSEWLNDKNFKKRLVPVTLFRLSNFEGYVEASQGFQTTDEFCNRWGIQAL